MKRPCLIRAGLLALLLPLFSHLKSAAQSPGQIIKPATGAGLSILDPNNDGYVSEATTGFSGSDVDHGQTELNFRVIRPLNFEPTGDLLRGPTGGFSDLVTAADSTGCFLFSDGTNLIFRLRLGNYIPGSKGYTILVDTDGKMGLVGPLADPGYTSPGNGRAGNPGFEYEISFHTNFRVAVYNVDTPGKVVLKHSNTPVTAFSQVSVALSYTSGNPDYFYDFYVPFSQLGINAATPLRFAITTVMSPLPALDGPMSDIWGTGNVTNVMDALTQIVTYQTPTTAGSTSRVSVCTAPPSVNAPTVGAIAVTGSWSRLDATKPSTSKIFLYRNGALVDSVTATSGAGWSIPVSAVAAGSTFYARAQATGEGQCFSSASVIAVKCIGTSSARPTITCISNKGIDGSFPVSNSRIRVYTDVAVGSAGLSSFTLYADSTIPPGTWNPTPVPFVLHDNATKAFKCDGTDGNGQTSAIGNTACTGGNTADMPVGPMAVTAQEPGKCESMPLFICPNGTVTATPTVTGTLYPGSTISGTTVANGYVRLYVDSTLRGATTADGTGAFSFTAPGLTAGSRVDVFAQASSPTCVSAAVTRTVQRPTPPPVITTDYTGLVGLGVTSISGTSTEPVGTTVFLYKRSGSTTTFMGQATVGANGTWTVTGIPATTNTDVYGATQQAVGGSLSDSSNLARVPAAITTSCVTLSAASYPANTSAIGGTVSPALTAGTVYLYIDGALADSATSVTTSFSIPVNTTVFNKLYAGASVSLTARTSGGSEKTDCSAASTATITCSSLGTPTVTLSPASIFAGSTTVANVSGTTSGLQYTLVASPSNGIAYARSQTATGTTLAITSYPFAAAGTYPMAVRVVNLNEGGTCADSSAPVSLAVTAIPTRVQLLHFSARAAAQGAMLQWRAVASDDLAGYSIERSTDGRVFATTGYVAAEGSGQERTYDFIDASFQRGKAWYRLRMEDRAGGATYSSVAGVNAHNSGSSAVTVLPNPFSNHFAVTVEMAEAAIIEVRVRDAVGRVCASQVEKLEKGLRSIAVSRVGQLSSGVYVVEVLQDGRRIAAQRMEKR